MNHTKKASFYTLGCKLNFSETSSIARDLQEAGYARVEFNETPDVYVINTCSVTENADKKCRQLVKKALKVNADAFVVVIGCYAQLKPKEISAIPGVDLVLGANEKFNLPNHLESIEKNQETLVYNEEIKTVKEFNPAYSKGDRTRTFLKVQDGCDYFCSFCTIPLARGRSRSTTIAETIKVANEVASQDVKEVVLTGVNIGDFGNGTDENFFGLVKELDKIEGIERFRISSIEPNLLSNEIIEYTAGSKKFVPHYHIPLQSGNDELLKRMRRRYLSDLYIDRVKKIKTLMPDCCIGVDVIVGFPGETEQHFETTVNLLKDLPVSYLHVFTYSERDNTTAVRMDEVVPMKERQARSKLLRTLSAKKKRRFYEENFNTTRTVLFEEEENEGFMYGFTENYVKIRTKYNGELVNKLAEVKLGSTITDECVNIVEDHTTLI